MFYVYLLKDENNKIYIGYTNNLKRRIREHTFGKTYWVRRMNRPNLFYYEAYINRELALEREKKLKKRVSSYQGLCKRIGLK